MDAAPVAQTTHKVASGIHAKAHHWRNPQKIEAAALIDTGVAFERSGYPNHAFECYIEAKEKFEVCGYKNGVAAARKLIGTLDVDSVNSRLRVPVAIPEAGNDPDPSPPGEKGRHMSADAQRVVESFKRLSPEQKQEVLAELELAYKKNARAVLSRPPAPVKIGRIPKWRSRKLDGPATDFLKKHYGRWLHRFGAPEDRVYQDEIRHHNLELIHGIQNQLREAGEGEKVSDYLPTRSARIDAVIENYPEAAVKNPRIWGTLYSRVRRAAKPQASNQPRI